MATNIYRVTLKSQEQRGASQPNIVELGFASDGDATQFGQNLATICSAKCVTVDNMISTDYVLPYPEGTNGMTRSALTNGSGQWMQMRVYDIPSAFNPVTRAAALITAGFLMYPSLIAPTSVNITVFEPGQSV